MFISALIWSSVASGKRLVISVRFILVPFSDTLLYEVASQHLCSFVVLRLLGLFGMKKERLKYGVLFQHFYFCSQLVYKLFVFPIMSAWPEAPRLVNDAAADKEINVFNKVWNHVCHDVSRMPRKHELMEECVIAAVPVKQD